MTITEFARSRNEQVNTVSKYIREHSEFEGHVTSKGKQRILDDVAIELLDVKYPLPKPVILQQGVPQEEHLKALQEKDEQIQQLQKVIIEMQAKQGGLLEELGELRGKTLLLEDREKQIEEYKGEIDKLKSKTFLQRLFNI